MGIRAFAAALASVVWLAACGGGGGGGPSSVPPPSNQAPSANAGQDIAGPIEAEGVQVGGDFSSDPDGDTLTYLWTILSQPEGAEAELDDETALQPKLLTQVPGTYELELAATDPAGATGYDRVSVSLVNDPPVPAISGLFTTPALGEEVELSAVETKDPNGQPLEFTWTLESAPPGSALDTEYVGMVQKIIFDVKGEYRFSLAVSDGIQTVTIDVPVISATEYSIRKLPAAGQARAIQPGGDRLVVYLQGQSGSRDLAIYDKSNHDPVLVPLESKPLSIAVSPDGHFAVLAGANSIVFVDLDLAEIISSWPVDFIALDIAMSNEGYAYIFNKGDGSTDMLSINALTGQLKTTQGRFDDLRGYIHPSSDKVYVMTGIVPNELGRFDISGGNFNDYRISPITTGICGAGWMAGDGGSLPTYCGQVMKLTDDPATDMSLLGSVSGFGGEILSATFSPITKYWYILGPPDEEHQSKILVYDSRDFDLIHTMELPPENGLNGTQLIARFITASQTDATIRILALDHPTVAQDFYLLEASLDYPAGANLPPAVTLQKYSAGYAGENITLDASTSSDPEGLPLTYAWEVISEPNPDAAILTDANSPVVRISPSLEGEYVVQLTVSDGVHQVVRQVTVSVAPDHGAAFYRLPGNVLDAEYSKSLSMLAYVVEGESSVRLVDLLSFTERQVPLERQAYRIGLSPDGRQAAVSLSGKVDLIDLASAKVTDSAPVSWDWGDIVLDGNGRAHFDTEKGSVGPLVSVDFGADEVSLAYNNLDLGTVLRMHPLESWVYGVSTRQIPAVLRKWDVATLSAQATRAETIGTDKDELGGNIWFSEDGTRMLTATGKLFTISSDYYKDLLLDKSIQDGIFAAWADHSSETGKWAVAIGDSTNVPSLDGKVAFYDDQTLTRTSVDDVRDVPIGGALYPVLATRIFYSDDGSGQVLLTSNGGATIDPFTVQVLNLTN